MQRKGGRRRTSGGHGDESADAVLDRLYTTPPADFVPLREELAAAARTAGRKDDARRIHAARRPTLAAWAANLLVHSQPEETRRFLELGQALREAHRTLDAAGLKDLSEQRRHIVAVLAAQAARLAEAAGHRLSPAASRDVESTLRAVLADPDAAGRWADGHLESALTPPSGFPAPAAASVPAGSAPSGRPSPSKSPRAGAGGRAGDDLAERRRKREEERARAREEREAAELRLRERLAEREDAEEALRQADQEHDRAGGAVAAAEEQLRLAQEELDRIERVRREAGGRSRAAAAAVAGAEREARTAQRRVDRLSTRGG